MTDRIIKIAVHADVVEKARRHREIYGHEPVWQDALTWTIQAFDDYDRGLLQARRELGRLQQGNGNGAIGRELLQ